MKTIFLILFPIFSFCQSRDSLNVEELLKVIASRNNAIKVHYNDTIPCLLLVCDTTKYLSADRPGWYEIDHQVWWKPGYVVIEKYSYDPEPLIFLDRRRNVLDKKLVVWLLKEL